MKEKFLSNVDRNIEFMFGKSDPSEDVEWLLSPGRIEQLVREGRAPLEIGSVGQGSIENGMVEQPYFEVPPRGFHPDDIEKIYDSMGVFVFVNKLGIPRVGATFTLTHEQAEEVGRRIDAELERLGLSDPND